MKLIKNEITISECNMDVLKEQLSILELDMTYDLISIREAVDVCISQCIPLEDVEDMMEATLGFSVKKLPDLIKEQKKILKSAKDKLVKYIESSQIPNTVNKYSHKLEKWIEENAIKVDYTVYWLFNKPLYIDTYVLMKDYYKAIANNSFLDLMGTLSNSIHDPELAMARGFATANDGLVTRWNMSSVNINNHKGETLRSNLDRNTLDQLMKRIDTRVLVKQIEKLVSDTLSYMDSLIDAVKEMKCKQGNPIDGTVTITTSRGVKVDMPSSQIPAFGEFQVMYAERIVNVSMIYTMAVVELLSLYKESFDESAEILQSIVLNEVM